ncbi:hypothetical protein ACIF70_37075 [Actinacidiphila glaucinigra]|uniref:hypothetical protein n=1 Tax=Actinacidiphila glaucinigra TaxID=235986 RepID=UPI0037C8E209
MGWSRTVRRAGEIPVAAVTRLRDDWSQARTDPARPGPRAHEILENTVQFELTGRTGFGGGHLGSARAHPDGTPEGDREPDHAERTLDTFGAFGSDGERIPPPRLSRVQRQKVDAALDELVERLAPVTTLCEPRRTV